MTVVLRPGAAVHAVDEGLLFSGWSGGGLMACSPGVVKLWRTVEPVLRTGTDPDGLRQRLPDKAAAVLDQILATLSTHDMLMPATASESPAYLAAIAPDPSTAAHRTATVRLRLTGSAAEESGVEQSLTRAGFLLDDGADKGTGEGTGEGPVWTVAVGEWTPGADIAAVVLGDAVLVGAAADVADATAATAYNLGRSEWALTRAIVVDRVLQLCAGLAPPPVLIRDGQARQVGGTPEPEPGDLPQLPLAQQRIRWAGREAVGAGVDQGAAADDARRAAVRAGAAERDGDGWSFGPIGAAGGDALDLWIDAIGRLLVAQADPPTEAAVAELPRTRRWWRAVTRRDGRSPILHCGVTRLGVALAMATSSRRESWGYGADRASAAEQAVRGLLVSTAPPGRVLVSHDAAAVAALRPLLGDRDRVTEAIPGLRFETWDADGAGLLAGRVGLA